jgi:hypothetical protein
MSGKPKPVGRKTVWFLRIAGPAVLLEVIYHAYFVHPEDWGYAIMMVPLYVGTGIGLGIVFFQHGRNWRLALPFILMMAGLAWAFAAAIVAAPQPGSVPGERFFQLQAVGAWFQLAAYLAMTWVGWRTPLPPRS